MRNCLLKHYCFFEGLIDYLNAPMCISVAYLIIFSHTQMIYKHATHFMNSCFYATHFMNSCFYATHFMNYCFYANTFMDHTET